MTRREKRIIGECLRAAAFGPFFRSSTRRSGDDPYALVQTLLGVTHGRLVEIARVFPDVDGDDPDVVSAIVGAMNNLTGYPHGEDRAWTNFISVTSKHVRDVSERWYDLDAYERGDEEDGSDNSDELDELMDQ